MEKKFHDNKLEMSGRIQELENDVKENQKTNQKEFENLREEIKSNKTEVEESVKNNVVETIKPQIDAIKTTVETIQPQLNELKSLKGDIQTWVQQELENASLMKKGEKPKSKGAEKINENDGVIMGDDKL